MAGAVVTPGDGDGGGGGGDADESAPPPEPAACEGRVFAVCRLERARRARADAAAVRRESGSPPPRGSSSAGLGASPSEPSPAVRTPEPSPVRTDSHVRAALDDAHRAGRRFRRRVQLPMLALSVAAIVLAVAFVGAALALGLESLLVLPICLASPASLGLLASLVPSQPRLVERATQFYVCLLISFGAAFGYLASLDARGTSAVGARGAAQQCDHHLLGPVPCWLAAVHLGLSIFWAGICMGSALRLLGALRGPSARARGARGLIEASWRVSGLALLLSGLCAALYVGAGLASGVVRWAPPSPPRSRAEAASRAAPDAGYWLSWCVCAAEFVGLGGVMLLPSTRLRIQTWLAARGEAFYAAAGIAALMGDQSPDELQAEAQRLFRCISLAEIAFAELAASTPDPSLFARSRPAKLNEVDAFVSHSWSDDAGPKWAALQSWRARFKAAHRREPLVWLDKACLDQAHIDEALRCLPVFLAGCGALLVLQGPTYLSRLWCVIELFVFIEMGGALSQIELRPLHASAAALAVPTTLADADAAGGAARTEGGVDGGAGGTPAAPAPAQRTAEPAEPAAAQPTEGPRPEAETARSPSGPQADSGRGAAHAAHAAHPDSAAEAEAWLAQLRAFDVGAAGCLLERDRARLLGIIEAGFGGAGSFNAALQGVLLAVAQRQLAADAAAAAKGGGGAAAAGPAKAKGCDSGSASSRLSTPAASPLRGAAAAAVSPSPSARSAQQHRGGRPARPRSLQLGPGGGSPLKGSPLRPAAATVAAARR